MKDEDYLQQNNGESLPLEKKNKPLGVHQSEDRGTAGRTRLIERRRHIGCGKVKRSKMPHSCAAWNCTNRFTAHTRSNGMTFHRFPKDKELRKRWEAAVRRVGFSASTSSMLCSDHFRPENFDRTGQTVRIRAGTVPSVFRFPSHLHGPVDPRRSQTLKKSRKSLSLDWSQLVHEDEPLPWKHDHSYALHSSEDELRARLREALARVESLEEDLRSKNTESDLLEDLGVKKLLNEEFKEQLNIYPEDQQLLVIKEEEDLHLWSSSLDQQDVELVQIKKEEEELWTNQEGEQLAGRSEEDDTPEVFQLHQIKVEDNRETQTNGEVCGGPEPDRTPGPALLRAERQPEDQQLLVNKEEEDLHLWSSILDQQDVEIVQIKKEEEELWISQEGEQLAVRSEDDDTPKVFQLHRIKAEDNRETQTNGEVCGGPEPHRNHDPDIILPTKNDKRAKDSSETEVSEDETDYWMETVSVSGSAKDDYDWREPLSSELGAKSKLGRKSSKKTFSCLECFKSFPNKPLFQKHMSTHSGEGPSSLVVQNVETSCKNGEKPFSCVDCGKTFIFPSQLKRHRRVHTGEKPFSCVDCGKMFRFPSQLKCHRRVHTGEKPFSCDKCGKAFSQLSSLKLHMMHHTGEKPFQCEVCEISFYTQGHLNQHMLIHKEDKPFACSCCNKRFRLRKYLVAHTTSHSGEKPFCCSDCSATFSHRQSLNWHAMLHTGQSLFACDKCDKRFLQTFHLKKHMLIHLKDKLFTES